MALLALVGLLSMLLSPVLSVRADTISNSVDATVDAVAEVMSLNVGGANGTTTLFVNPANGDGKNGCNLTSNSELAVSVASSNPGVATVSPSTVTFRSCGDTPTLTVSPLMPGSTTISLLQTSNTTGGTFDLAPATFTVTVAPPANTAPTVSVASVTAGTSYLKGSVPTATCQVTDAEDGNSSFAATLSTITGDYASDGIGSQTASCSYSDHGSLTATASATYSIVDPSAPGITKVVNPATPDGAHGWYTSNVSLDWTVTESESPSSLAMIGCVDQSITQDQDETTYTCSATSAGGSASEVTVSVKRDATAPVIAGYSGVADGDVLTYGQFDVLGWACTATDALSGINAYTNETGDPISCDLSGRATAVGPHTLTAKARDNAGNQVTESVIHYTVVDGVAPSISDMPENMTLEATGPGGAVATWTLPTAEDDVDGPVAVICDIASGSTVEIGTTTVTCSAVDDANNESTGTFTVTVSDTTKPGLNLPDDITIEATGPTGAAVTFAVTAQDLVDGDLLVSCDATSGDAFPVGLTTVRCSATDVAGNSVTGSFAVTVTDTTPPVLSALSNTTVEATSAAGAVATFTATATDLVDGNVAVTCRPASGTTFPFGSTQVTCSATDVAGNEASGDFLVTVVDTTAPIITLASRTAANSNGWNNGTVTVIWTCTDSGSGLENTTVSETVSAEGANQAATGTCLDRAGNEASDAQTGIHIDTTAPVVTAAVDRAANGNGWYNADVTVGFTCTDSLSGVALSPADQMLAEGANQSATGICTDNAGNSANAEVSGINIDKTAPVIAVFSRTAVNSNGWNNGPVTVTWSCSDGGSGVVNATDTKTTSSEGTNQSLTGTCADRADNSNSASVTGINIDTTAPTVDLLGGPASGASYYFGNVPAAPTCSGSDAISGLANACEVSGYGIAVGPHTVTASATDMAGNTAFDTRFYTVLSWQIKGFYAPVDMGNVYNTVKGGSTVPLKFEVFSGSTELTATAAIKSFTQARITCDGLAFADDIEVTTTGGTSLRYDATSGQFVQNWQTPKAAGSCYRVTMTTQDGSSISANFKLK